MLNSRQLSWQEMICLHKHRIGLRAVADENAALDAKENGGYGDAVSLAAFGFCDKTSSKLNPLTADPLVINSANIFRQNKYKFLSDEKYIDQHFPQDKKDLQTQFLNGIDEHVEKAVFAHKARAFILVTMDDTLQAYDFGAYPLGKCGDQTFTSEQVKKIITIPTIGNPYATVIAGIKDFCRAQMQAQSKLTQENQKFTLLAPKQTIQEAKADSRAAFTWSCVIL